MDRVNKNAIGELVARVGCGAVIIAIAVLLIIELI